MEFQTNQYSPSFVDLSIKRDFNRITKLVSADSVLVFNLKLTRHKTKDFTTVIFKGTILQFHKTFTAISLIMWITEP